METTTNRQLFITEKVEILTIEELKQTVSAKDMGYNSKTRPVSHFQFIEDLMRILNEAGQAPVLDHIYCAKSSGTKIIPKIEEQYGVEKVLEAWIIDKVTGKILIPSLQGEETQGAIAFSYHDKGLDLAFGSNVHDCQNMCIFGSNIMHTYGSKKDVNYERMLQVFKEWSGNLVALRNKDLTIIESMKRINITGFEMLRFTGKLLVNAVSSNIGIKCIAPLNVSQVNEVVRGIIAKKGEKFYEGPDCTLWEFYNFMTAVMKANKADITTLITDIAAIGEMMVEEYKVMPTIDVVDLDKD